MKKMFPLAVTAAALVVAALVFSSTEAFGQPHRKTGPGPLRPSAPGAKTNETYMVIKVGDDYRAIRTTDLSEEKKRVKEDYDQAMKEWHDAKKIDANAKAPVRQTILTIQSGFKTMKGAEEYIAVREKKEGKDPSRTNPYNRNVPVGPRNYPGPIGPSPTTRPPTRY